MVEQYSSQIIRNRKVPYGPGFETLFLGEEPVECWPVITGHFELDPTEYGGVIPAIRVVQTGRIHPHQEPNSLVVKQDHCVIIPYSEDVQLAETEYERRTWYRDGDRFKRHSVRVGKGKSTGCICVPEHWWRYAKRELNLAYKHSVKHKYEFVSEIIEFENA